MLINILILHGHWTWESNPTQSTSTVTSFGTTQMQGKISSSQKLSKTVFLHNSDHKTISKERGRGRERESFSRSLALHLYHHERVVAMDCNVNKFCTQVFSGLEWRFQMRSMATRQHQAWRKRTGAAAKAADNLEDFIWGWGGGDLPPDRPGVSKCYMSGLVGHEKSNHLGSNCTYTVE